MSTPLIPETNAQSIRYRFGKFAIDRVNGELSTNGKPVALEAKPRDLLLHLLKHRDETLSKDELFEACWPGRILTEGTLAKAVMKLRIALRDDAGALIKTIHGVGYRWIAPLQIDVIHARPPLDLAAMQLKAGDVLPMRPNWQLQRALGRGGFGEVWLAKQCKSDACTVFKYVFDSAGLGALKREVTLSRLLRDALVNSDALVLPTDWNFDELPYFIEYPYFAAGNLLDWAGSQGGLNEISIENRIEIAAKIADALASAHSVGVLHKDLKPSNILMRKDPLANASQTGTSAEQWQPCLSDFGSGRALDPDRLTALGITALGLTKTAAASDSPGGTPLYLAPELIRGESSSMKVDIYALGVICYQLIVGDFRKHLAPGWEREISDPLLIADIALAAETNSNLRLGDAAELARRLRALPERRQQAAIASAQADAIMQDRARLQRSQQRRQFWRATTAIAVLAALALAGMSWQQQRAQRQAQAVSSFLVNLFRDSDPTRGSDPGLSARELIQAGVLRVQSDQGLPGAVRIELTQLLADIQLRLGDSDNAGNLLAALPENALAPGMRERMQGQLAAIRGEQNDALRHFQTSLQQNPTPETKLLLARAHSEAGNSAEAMTRLQAVLAKPADLSDAIAASAWLSLGVLHWRQGQPEKALEAYAQSELHIAASAMPISPVPLHINRGLALNDLAQFKQALDEYAQAEAALARFPNFKNQGLILQNRGMTYLRMGKAQAAQDEWLGLLAKVDQGRNPGLEASTVHNLASSADVLNDPIASVGYSLQAMHLREKLGDAPGALSSRINIIAKLYTFGLAPEGVLLAKGAVARATSMQRPDLAARARAVGASSACVTAPNTCTALLEQSALEFAAQKNRVKHFELLEKWAVAAFELGEPDAQSRSVAKFARAVAQTPSAPLQERLSTLKAMQLGDTAALRKLAPSSALAVRALVQIALRQPALSPADIEKVKLQLQTQIEPDNDRYLALSERLAEVSQNQVELARIKAKRNALRERVKALIAGLDA